MLVQIHLRKDSCFLSMSMFVQGLSCSAIQYYDESLMAFQLILYKFSGMAGKLTHSFPRPRREDVVSHPVSE